MTAHLTTAAAAADDDDADVADENRARRGVPVRHEGRFTPSDPALYDFGPGGAHETFMVLDYRLSAAQQKLRDGSAQLEELQVIKSFAFYLGDVSSYVDETIALLKRSDIASPTLELVDNDGDSILERLNRIAISSTALNRGAVDRASILSLKATSADEIVFAAMQARWRARNLALCSSAGSGEVDNDLREFEVSMRAAQMKLLASTAAKTAQAAGGQKKKLFSKKDTPQRGGAAVAARSTNNNNDRHDGGGRGSSSASHGGAGRGNRNSYNNNAPRHTGGRGPSIAAAAAGIVNDDE